ncbi:MAG TPA: tetratricopeptide repeat protein [Terriglobales bacterium]
MNATRRVEWETSVLLLLCLAGSVFMLRRVERIRSSATLREVLFISSPQAAKRLSLGYDGLMADIYWTRAVQYFGNHHAQGAEEYKLLAPLLGITTALDPHLTVAYEFGSTFLSTSPPNGAGMPQEAVKLVEYGIKNNPDDWHLYYNLGFIYYLELKDYKNAADAFRRGSQLPHTHPWLKILAARMSEHAGDLETARMMWSAAYQTSTDKQVKANAAAHLRALDVDETVPILESMVDKYRRDTGHMPLNFANLVRSGALTAIPRDPTGRPYKIMPDGHVEVSKPDALPFIEKGTPPGYVAPPPKFSYSE